MLAKRIIPCLDVREGKVVKGVQFRNHEIVGEIEALAERYSNEGADELVFYDISASPDGRSVSRDWVRRVSDLINIPFCVAGGIRSIADAESVLEKGADKISINSPALRDPSLIDRLVKRFGTQCVVVGIDSHHDGEQYSTWRNTGDETKASDSGRMTLDWIKEVQDRGAGEIVLNCMNQDGVRKGYDTKQLAAVRRIATVPVIASGGAGEIAHFTDVFKHCDVSGALAASVFHKSIVSIEELKKSLIDAGITIRPYTPGS